MSHCTYICATWQIIVHSYARVALLRSCNHSLSLGLPVCIAPRRYASRTPSQHLDRSGHLPATILFEPTFPLAIFVISLVNCKFLRTICSSPGACPQQRWLPTDGTLVVFQLYAQMITVRVSASCISVVALLKIQHALLGQHLSVERPFAHWLAMCWAPFLQSAASCLALTRHRL